MTDLNAAMNRLVNAVRAELGMDEFRPLEDLEQKIGDAVDPTTYQVAS